MKKLIVIFGAKGTVGGKISEILSNGGHLVDYIFVTFQHKKSLISWLNAEGSICFN